MGRTRQDRFLPDARPDQNSGRRNRARREGHKTLALALLADLAKALSAASSLDVQYFLRRALPTLNRPMNSADVTGTRCFAREEQLVVQGF